MAKDGHVCYYRRLFANSVKPHRCTTEPVKPPDGINKDVSDATPLLMTTSVYPVDCACVCPLLKTQHHCLCPTGSCNSSSASHPPLPPSLIQAIRDITVAGKKVTQNPAVLAS